MINKVIYQILISMESFQPINKVRVFILICQITLNSFMLRIFSCFKKTTTGEISKYFYRYCFNNKGEIEDPV